MRAARTRVGQQQRPRRRPRQLPEGIAGPRLGGIAVALALGIAWACSDTTSPNRQPAVAIVPNLSITPAYGADRGFVFQSRVGADRCMDGLGYNTALGAVVGIWSCNGSANQQWRWGADGTIRTYFNGVERCLDAPTGSAGDGLTMYSCHGGWNQLWEPGPDGLSIRLKGTTYCITVPNWDTTPGTQLALWYCNGSTAQQWDAVLLGYARVQADVTVQASGGYDGFPVDSAVRSVSFHTIRSFDANGVWTIRNEFAPPPTPLSTAEPITYVAATEMADDGSFFRMYDQHGALIDQAPSDTSEFSGVMGGFRPDGAVIPGPYPRRATSAPPPDEPDPDPRCLRPPCPTVPLMRVPRTPAAGPALSVAPTGSPALGAVGGAAAPSNKQEKEEARGKEPEAWIDQVYVTPEARVRQLARLEKRYGKAKQKVGKLDRYLRKRGDQLMELLVDADVGAVVEENIAVRGELLAHTRRHFAKDGDVYVNTVTRTELARRVPGGQPLVVTTILSNVRVTRDGGAR